MPWRVIEASLDMDAPSVQYVTTSDGYDLAYAVRGTGRDLALIPEPISHIQIYWSEDTFVRPWLRELSSHFRLVQYDGRGQGMSGRGLKPGHSHEDEVRDLEAVVERLELRRFILVGRTHAAVRYATTHPERLDALVLFALPVAGSSWPAEFFVDFARNDWEMFVRAQASFANAHQILDSERRIKQSITQGDWLLRAEAWFASNISDLLASLDVPTLVIQPRDVAAPSLQETARLVGRIAGARLAVIDGVTPLGDAEQGVAQIERFLAELPLDKLATDTPGLLAAAHVAAVNLSPRELDVLRLLAAGRSNQEIADALVISRNTVRRHVSNVFDKTGAATRAQAMIFARDHGLNGPPGPPGAM